MSVVIKNVGKKIKVVVKYMVIRQNVAMVIYLFIFILVRVKMHLMGKTPCIRCWFITG